MNSNRRVLLFTLYSICIYLLLSIVATFTGFSWEPFNKINLVADIVKGDDKIKTPADASDTSETTPPIVADKIHHKDFALYNKPGFITSFNADTSLPTLERFLKKLYALKSGSKKKIRIAYFGDSIIEGDLLTETFRKLLQQQFGGSGVGFVPITSLVSKFRKTVWDNYSDGWQEENFKTAAAKNLFFSGHLFRSGGDWVEMTDQTITDSAAILEKSLICGYVDKPLSITVNNAPLTIAPDKIFNRVVLSKDGRRTVKVTVADERLPVYGISFETESGVFVDNFSFRGVSGVELGKIDSTLLTAISTNNNSGEPYYDLLIFQYGVNVMFKPNEQNFTWYKKVFTPVIQRMKNCFPATDILMVSTADRAFNYGGEYKSAIGIDSLVKIQATIAYQTGCSFYNQYQTMGGKNAIVQWATATPSLANKDYIHPNNRGANMLATLFYDAIMKDYQKYLTTIK